MTEITWKQLTELEPRLLTLLENIRGIKDNKEAPSFCANAIWYGHRGRPSLKEEMTALVGWEAGHSADARLKTAQAYDVAYDVLYNALPDCRNCNCM